MTANELRPGHSLKQCDMCGCNIGVVPPQRKYCDECVRHRRRMSNRRCKRSNAKYPGVPGNPHANCVPFTKEMRDDVDGRICHAGLCFTDISRAAGLRDGALGDIMCRLGWGDKTSVDKTTLEKIMRAVDNIARK